MSSIYGKKVVAVLDTQSNFGIQFQSVVDNVSTLSGQMSTLLADSPETLNTLDEISAAIGDNPDFFNTMATANTTLQSNIDALSTAAATARTTLETALSGRLDVLEADATTATSLSALGTSLTAVDATLSGRIDVLELDPTTQADVDAVNQSLTISIGTVQADVNQNEADADAAIALKLDANNPTATGSLTLDTNACIRFDGNLTKIENVLRGTGINIGNNIEVNPAAAGGRLEVSGDLILDGSDLTNASNDVDAATAGIVVGQVYHDNGNLRVRVS